MTAKPSRMILTLLGGFLALGAVGVWAAKVPLSPEELEMAATHVISGKVAEVTSVDRKSEVERALGIHVDRVFTIKLKVNAIRKGTGVRAGDEVEVEAWQPVRRIPPLPGLQGHGSIPNKGDTVTVYVKGRKGKAYEPILPNGIVILTGAPARVAAEAEQDETTVAPKASRDVAVEAARKHLRAVLACDPETLKATYAPKVELMPGHEFLKDEYGLTEPGARARGATVERGRLIAAMEKASANRPPRPAERIDAMLKTLTYNTLKTAAGEFVTEPADGIGTPDGKLHFAIQKGDVLLKVAPPKGDFLLLHLRQEKGKWKVVSEYID